MIKGFTLDASFGYQGKSVNSKEAILKQAHLRRLKKINGKLHQGEPKGQHSPRL